MPTILMTGAAVAQGPRSGPGSAAPGRTLRLLDVAPLTAGTGEEARHPGVGLPTWTR